MALVNCVECGARISNRANMCPKCGSPEPFLSIQNKACPECSSMIPCSSPECPECGFPSPFGQVQEQKNIYDPQKWELYYEDQDYDFEELYHMAKSGDMHAQYEIGRFYEYRTSSIPKNYLPDECKDDFFPSREICKEKAIEYYRKAAEQQHIAAQFELGVFYQGKKDLKQSEIWYTLAAENNHPHAQVELGTIYRKRGNKIQAEQWYRKAVEQDFMPGIIALADYYTEEGAIQEALTLTDRGAERLLHPTPTETIEDWLKEIDSITKDGDYYDWRCIDDLVDLTTAIALLYAKAKQMQKGMQWIEISIRAIGNIGRYIKDGYGGQNIYWIAQSYEELQLYSEALKLYSEIYKHGNTTWGAFYLGQCYDRQANYQLAIKWYHIALNDDDQIFKYNSNLKREIEDAIQRIKRGL